MAQSLPLVLVPGLTCTARLYGPQIAALWPFGPVTVADHRRDDDIGAVAARILDNAPPRFALAGLSYGRLHRLRDDAAGARAHRQAGAARHLGAPRYAGTDRRAQHANRHGARRPLRRNRRPVDPALSEREASDATSVSRRWCARWWRKPGRRPSCGSSRRSCRGRIRGRCWRSIRCPTLVLVGDGDAATPPDLQQGNRRRHCRREAHVIVPDCGHLSTLEKPEAVNAALAEWLAHEPAAVRAL